MNILEIKNLNKNFGGLRASNDINFSLGKGERLGILGPNGAGKTTIFNLISGFILPDSGEIIFNSKDIVGYLTRKNCLYGACKNFSDS